MSPFRDVRWPVPPQHIIDAAVLVRAWMDDQSWADEYKYYTICGLRYYPERPLPSQERRLIEGG